MLVIKTKELLKECSGYGESKKPPSFNIGR